MNEQDREELGARIVLQSYDRNWWRKCSYFDRVVLFLFRKTVNRTIKTILCRGMERGIVGPNAFHELAGICDRILWPNRH